MVSPRTALYRRVARQCARAVDVRSTVRAGKRLYISPLGIRVWGVLVRIASSEPDFKRAVNYAQVLLGPGYRKPLVYSKLVAPLRNKRPVSANLAQEKARSAACTCYTAHTHAAPKSPYNPKNTIGLDGCLYVLVTCVRDRPWDRRRIATSTRTW